MRVQIVSMTVAIAAFFASQELATAFERPVNAQGDFPLLEVKRNNTDVKDPNFRIDYLNWSKIPGHWVVKNYGDRFKWENVANKKLPNGTVCTLNAGNLVELKEQKKDYVRVRMVDGPCTSVWGYMRRADLGDDIRPPVEEGMYVVRDPSRSSGIATKNPDGSGGKTCTLFNNDLVERLGRNWSPRVFVRPIRDAGDLCKPGWLDKSALKEANIYNYLAIINQTVDAYKDKSKFGAAEIRPDCTFNKNDVVLIDSESYEHPVIIEERISYVRGILNKCEGWIGSEFFNRI